MMTEIVKFEAMISLLLLLCGREGRGMGNEGAKLCLSWVEQIGLSFFEFDPGRKLMIWISKCSFCFSLDHRLGLCVVVEILLGEFGIGFHFLFYAGVLFIRLPAINSEELIYIFFLLKTHSLIIDIIFIHLP